MQGRTFCPLCTSLSAPFHWLHMPHGLSPCFASACLWFLHNLKAPHLLLTAEHVSSWGRENSNMAPANVAHGSIYAVYE